MASVFETELDAALKAEPFEPFDVVLVIGTRYAVTSPDMMIVRDSVIDHFPYGTDERNLLRTNQLAVVAFHGLPADPDRL